MRDITELPHDLFLLVISYLSPRTCIRCRLVSRQWHAAFTDEVASLLLLRWNFPRCRELRLAAAAADLVSSSTSLPPNSLFSNLQAELIDVASHPHAWPQTFAHVARRYYHLSRGKPRVVEKLDMAVSSRENGSIFSFWGVAPWNRFLRLNEKTSNFHYPDPVWWYSQEDGVLVYPAAIHGHDDALSDECDGYVYHILDLSTGQRVPVPFDVRSKHIRRVRLAQGVLIFEWAEALPYHQLNDREVVHRHFVTAFDVVRRPSACLSGTSSSDVPEGSPRCTWDAEFRSEWKLHFLGLPLNRSDRFFSAHTATHYAVYFWQPNRSLYQDDPIEQLAVWDISSPSPYCPSEDPRGDKRPTANRAPSLPAGLWNGKHSPAVDRLYGLAGSSADFEKPRRASLATATAGPQVVRRMAWRELDFYGLRQRVTPQLRGLALDDRNLYVVEEEHRWADGQHSSLNPPRVHLVRSTGIPVVPVPASSSEPSYPVAARSTGDLSIGASQLVGPRPFAISTIIGGPVNGPIWVDACGADGDVNMNFCRRVASVNGPAGTIDIRPPLTGVLDPTSPGDLRPTSSAAATGWPWVPGGSKSSKMATSFESARWPGWAPCWRHEDFPYLTVAEMVDFAAGVRVTARHCFMLETLSVHLRPAVSVKGTPSANQDDGVRSSKKNAQRRDSSTKVESRRCEEAQLPDDMWSELVARGHIAGDERWIIGEDEQGRITVVRF